MFIMLYIKSLKFIHLKTRNLYQRYSLVVETMPCTYEVLCLIPDTTNKTSGQTKINKQKYGNLYLVTKTSLLTYCNHGSIFYEFSF